MKTNELYEQAKESESYKRLISNGFIDVSTKRQQTNGTFTFIADYKRIEYFPIKGNPQLGYQYRKELKKFGIQKSSHPDHLDKFSIRQHMESQPSYRDELELSYSDAFDKIFKIHEKYMKTKRKNPETKELEDGWNKQKKKVYFGSTSMTQHYEVLESK